MDDMSGFQPIGAQVRANSVVDDLDEEERERVAQVELEQEDLKRRVHEKTVREEEEKRQKKEQAKGELDQWGEERKKQIELRRKQNVESEQDYKESKTRKRNAPNPWERVFESCEMNSSNYVGGADVSRMRQAMI